MSSWEKPGIPTRSGTICTFARILSTVSLLVEDVARKAAPSEGIQMIPCAPALVLHRALADGALTLRPDPVDLTVSSALKSRGRGLLELDALDPARTRDVAERAGRDVDDDGVHHRGAAARLVGRPGVRDLDGGVVEPTQPRLGRRRRIRLVGGLALGPAAREQDRAPPTGAAGASGPRAGSGLLERAGLLLRGLLTGLSCSSHVTRSTTEPSSVPSEAIASSSCCTRPWVWVWASVSAVSLDSARWARVSCWTIRPSSSRWERCAWASRSVIAVVNSACSAARAAKRLR